MSPCSKSLCKHDWLVVDLPLWKIWKSVGMIIPNIWKNKNVWNHQPAIKILQIKGDVPLFKVALLTWYIYQKHTHINHINATSHKTNLANDQGGHHWSHAPSDVNLTDVTGRAAQGRFVAFVAFVLVAKLVAARSSGAVVGGSVGV